MESTSALARILAVFREMPGLSLTPPQVQALCGVEATLASGVLHRLVEDRVLGVTPTGRYYRTDGAAR